MPQMAPMNWLSLMTYMILIFMFFNIQNYFSFFYKKKSFKLNFKIFKNNWKW
uniref:ATP synthase complex subunit 8 n=1 Tax=Staphylinidae sp. BMNH 1274665 TaxID=1796589 RepID=A0A126TFY8_9COLE|nr:ATP synthase F0 subunit 8 [Staphylinidae sp. BMNH 1274665]